MNIYFWHQCLSPHQFTFIKELSHLPGIDKVFLIIPNYELKNRNAMGWEQANLKSQLEDVVLYVNPTSIEIKNIFIIQKTEDINVFDGLSAFPYIFTIFKISTHYNVQRYITTEPPFIYKYPLWMHYIRFNLLYRKYIKYITGIYSMGDLGVHFYKKISHTWKVIPFAYCVDHSKIIKKEKINKGSLKLVYVGSLSKRKNVQLIIKALHKCKYLENISLDIIGDGPERNSLINLTCKYKLEKNIRFMGNIPMNDVHKILQQYDTLILPSLHDGWGAVINEAMAAGLYVLCSEKCGAKTLITSSKYGIIFKLATNILAKIIDNIVLNKEDICKNFPEIIKHSEQFNGKSIAIYFKNSLTDSKYKEPWK